MTLSQINTMPVITQVEKKKVKGKRANGNKENAIITEKNPSCIFITHEKTNPKAKTNASTKTYFETNEEKGKKVFPFPLPH